MKRIMIVEDETAIREFEAINLKRVGYTVVEAGSGEEALEIYDSDSEGFDIALLDICVSGGDVSVFSFYPLALSVFLCCF